MNYKKKKSSICADDHWRGRGNDKCTLWNTDIDWPKTIAWNPALINELSSETQTESEKELCKDWKSDNTKTISKHFIMCPSETLAKVAKNIEKGLTWCICTALKATCLLSCLQMKIISFRMKLKWMQCLREVRIKIPRRNPLSTEMNDAHAWRIGVPDMHLLSN